MYYAPGSGVYVNTGKTITADNKLALLHAFNISFESIAARVFPFTGRLSRYIPGGVPSGGSNDPVYDLLDVYKFLSPSAAKYNLSTLHVWARTAGREFAS
eukprot:jgi/Botrbrau1/773/Bobra.0181s0027.1